MLKKIKEKNVKYYRDIPCKKDIFRAYYIGYKYGLVKNKTDLLGAIILKWIKEKKITIKKSDYNNEELIEHTPAILRPASKKAIEIIEKPKETMGNKR